MNNRKWIMLITALALMGVGSVALVRLRANQKLGEPGIKTTPIAGSPRLQIELPEQVAGYQSKPVETQQEVVDALPRDTSFGQRLYTAADGFETLVNIVLMGTDRTSIHKPQFCLLGSGWTIDTTEIARVKMERPQARELPVIKLTATKEGSFNGQHVKVRGIYVYWFVADGALSAEPTGFERMWLMARELFRTGVLQRWAYVTYFSICQPGQEEQTFDRIKDLIARSVPEFQLVTPPLANTQTAAAGTAGQQPD